jgi:hypothetical protein
MKRLNRRATSWLPMFIFLVGLLALTACWLILLDKDNAFQRNIGDDQYKLIQQYQQGERYLLFMDQAAVYTTYESVRQLAADGGSAGDTDCGTVGGYRLWNQAGISCYPTLNSLAAALPGYYNTIINDYSHVYVNETNITIYSLEYLGNDPLEFIARPERRTDFLMSEDGSQSIVLGEIVQYQVGAAGSTAYEKTVSRDMRNLSFAYSVVPVTEVRIAYSLEEYDTLVSEAEDLLRLCSGSNETDTCLRDHLTAGWTIDGNESSVYLFTVVGSHKLPFYDESQKEVIDQEVSYRFALDFS